MAQRPEKQHRQDAAKRCLQGQRKVAIRGPYRPSEREWNPQHTTREQEEQKHGKRFLCRSCKVSRSRAQRVGGGEGCGGGESAIVGGIWFEGLKIKPERRGRQKHIGRNRYTVIVVRLVLQSYCRGGKISAVRRNMSCCMLLSFRVRCTRRIDQRLLL